MHDLQAHIEQLTLNAWPPLQQLVHDGWQLRMAQGYTKRANSVQALWEGTNADLREKIGYCEDIYHGAGLKAIFKITSFTTPARLDPTLNSYGYRICEPSAVLIRSLESQLPEPQMTDIRVDTALSEEWLQTAASLLSLTPDQVKTARQLLSLSALRQGFFTLYKEGVPVACGLGVVEDGYIGLYDIVTDARSRNQGIGEQLVLHILRWGQSCGAHTSYLQVVQANLPANRLYGKLGYTELYRYWYRVRPH